MSKVLLINPDTPMERYLTRTELFPNGALLLLGTILQNRNHTVKLLHMKADGADIEKLKEIVKEFGPDVVGATAITFQSRTLREVTRAVKEVDSNIMTIVGGPHIAALASINHPLPEDYPDVDFFVAGEGDEILPEIIEGPPGLASGVIRPVGMPSLDSIPPLDLSLVNLKRFTGTYPPGPRPEMFVMGSRGCPFQCTFCSRSVFGNTVRYRNPVAVVDDAERLSKDWGVKEVFFHDDTFNLNRDWVEEVLGLIIKRRLNKRLHFRTPCRVNEELIDEDLLRHMKEAGFWLIFYGVESGSPYMLDRMKKSITVEEIKRAFKLTKEAGIKAEASFIVGMPGETHETVRESVELWREIKPHWSSFSRAIPFPGTELYEEVKGKEHLLAKNFDEYELDKTLCRTDDLSGEEVEALAKQLGDMVSKEKLKELLRHPIRLWEFISDLKDRNGLKRGIARGWDILKQF